MRQSDNKATIRRFYAAWNAQRMDEVVACIAPTFRDHAMPPEYAMGRAGFLRARELGARALADVAITIETLLDAENNSVVAMVIIHATQIGPYKRIPFMGVRHPIRIPAISVMRLENGQLVEHWECVDILPVLHDLRAEISVPALVEPGGGDTPGGPREGGARWV